MNQLSGAIVGPTGTPLTANDLPPPNTKRWVMRRKGEVVLAVRGGLISLEEICERYGLTKEEFQSWERLLDQHGFLGLRATRLQKYRGSAPKHEVAADLTNSIAMFALVRD